jgi:hypothetical protein
MFQLLGAPRLWQHADSSKCTLVRMREYHVPFVHAEGRIWKRWTVISNFQLRPFLQAYGLCVSIALMVLPDHF